MSIIALLHNLLKEKLPSIHATRLIALMAASRGWIEKSVGIDCGARTDAFPDLPASNTKLNAWIA